MLLPREPYKNSYQFLGKGCSVNDWRKNLWNGYLSSIGTEINWCINNTYITLIKEPDNVYDKNAIKIMLKGEFYGTAGYVGREYLPDIKEILDSCRDYRVEIQDYSKVGQNNIPFVIYWK